MLWFIGAAAAADIHARLQTGDGVAEEGAWPTVETFSKRWGPVGDKVSTVWSVTAQPSVWDPIEVAYRAEITVCAEWSKGKNRGKTCEKSELLVRSEPASVTRETKESGVKHNWTLTTWYSGETPPSGLPAPQPEG